MTTKTGLFGGIVGARQSRRTRFLGAALALATWGTLWTWAVAGVAAPLGATLRAGGTRPAAVAVPVAPAADVVSGPRIAAARCAC